MKLAIALLAVIALAAPGQVRAQEFAAPRVNVKLIDDRTGERVKFNLPVTKRTVDRTFLTLAGVSQAFTVADVENSMYALREPGVEEQNSLFFGHHPGRGRYYAVSEAVFALTSYVSYRAKRERDAAVAFGAKPDFTHRMWFIPLLSNSGWHAIGVGFTIARTGR